jgi:hypothetical protein
MTGREYYFVLNATSFTYYIAFLSLIRPESTDCGNGNLKGTTGTPFDQLIHW